jgi:plasmid stability protein
MGQVLVRDVPDEVVERLKKRAAAQGRSLQAELRRVLIEGAGADLKRVRLLAARMRKQLGGRVHSDSAELLAEDRER